ncbi:MULTISPECIES: Zn(2+)-responsive transcriptional regulator [unclassified Agarivorans]|uniref:Zn(2+)-responsive transcriptional regulator n=1 Tax=unclassified Agarivorans TaxID=2636026 RepID=UPI0026E4039B|nr:MULTISPECIES: Zn(2+)-responsive transcriptional regulator [unclassified Agarivorans]MDO6686720.1 Zn(2+)-responsive transcriptional regulator [Agarivorans sp. 3_MG-2023]MDO6716550.1 Zn(2+)-responsive transcriptional regulator [Agarivorans sp. 2_MG-2023]MDO6765488.1 Zn(2+)-responsive transcriptional regulator [Agarivorans sp. 1_MG-2023]
MYKIGELAKLSGLTVEALRFYERKGLLAPVARGANQYRMYSEQDLARLGFIQRAKQAGLSIKDILELLTLREHAETSSCGDVSSVVAHKLYKVQEQLLQLQAFEATLKKLHDECCGGEESATSCSILKALDDVIE